MASECVGPASSVQMEYRHQPTFLLECQTRLFRSVLRLGVVPTSSSTLSMAMLTPSILIFHAGLERQ